MSNDSDESNNNGLYLLLLAVIIIGLGVAYSRLPTFREIVDSKAPWFKEKVGHFLVNSKPGDEPSPSGGDASSPGGTAPDGAISLPPVTMATFEAHREGWPKTLRLTKSREFPVVVNGTKFGTVMAPVGSQVELVDVKNGNLGVKYQGGGAWVLPDATDLKERVHFAGGP